MIGSVEPLRAIRRHLEIVSAHGWNAAAAALDDRAKRELTGITCYCGQADSAIKTRKPAPVLLRDVLGELQQTQVEFGHLNYQPKEKLLSIITDPIELQDVYLGEFEVRLDLTRLDRPGHDSAYSVIALDPHPASSNEDVTHPHVRDEQMCEGDATAPIGAALASGRIFDFFSLVKGVLTTYNPSSPHVSLDYWDGVSCYECGNTVSSDDLHYCNSCENEFCDNCSSYCPRCDNTTCGSCLSKCLICEELVCPTCLTKCPHCGRALCKACLENDQCPCVQERKDRELHEQQQANQPARRAATPRRRQIRTRRTTRARQTARTRAA